MTVSLLKKISIGERVRIDSNEAYHCYDRSINGVMYTFMRHYRNNRDHETMALEVWETDTGITHHAIWV